MRRSKQRLDVPSGAVRHTGGRWTEITVKTLYLRVGERIRGSQLKLKKEEEEEKEEQEEEGRVKEDQRGVRQECIRKCRQ